MSDINYFIDSETKDVFVKQISKFENYNISEYQENFPPYTKTLRFTEFWFYLINNLRYDGFRKIFEALGSLIWTDDASFIELILPYLVYYVIRFSEGTVVLDKMTNTLFEILEYGSYRHKMIVFSVIDFIKIWFEQDKAVVASYIVNQTNFRYTENLIKIKIKHDQESAENEAIQSFLDIIRKSESVKCSFITVNRILNFMNKIHDISPDTDQTIRPFLRLYKAAKSIKDYKRAVIYLEEHLRSTTLHKNYAYLLELKTKQVWKSNSTGNLF